MDLKIERSLQEESLLGFDAEIVVRTVRIWDTDYFRVQTGMRNQRPLMSHCRDLQLSLGVRQRP